MQEIDYYLSWELLEMPAAEEHYTERLWRMDALSGWQERVPAPPPAEPADLGLPSAKHLYLCPQTLERAVSRATWQSTH